MFYVYVFLCFDDIYIFFNPFLVVHFCAPEESILILIIYMKYGFLSCLYYSGISLYLVSGIVRMEVLFVTAKGVFSVLKRVLCFH